MKPTDDFLKLAISICTEHAVSLGANRPTEAEYSEAFKGVPLPTLTSEDIDKMAEADQAGRFYDFSDLPVTLKPTDHE